MQPLPIVKCEARRVVLVAWLEKIELRARFPRTRISVTLRRRITVRWSKPKVREICVGLEINDYFPAEI